MNDNNVISYDIFELDLYGLKQKISDLKVNEVVVYGIGNNGYETFRLLKNIGVKIKYFIDVKANNDVKAFKGIEVKSPEEFADIYGGEYVIITPSVHEKICEWMQAKKIPENKLIIAFYKTESISIDYGGKYLNGPSNNIVFYKKPPVKVLGTFVTIAYNTPENLFRRAIESVLNQTVHDLKYLIIINGATDNTASIAKEYASFDSRITIIDMGGNLPWTDKRLLNLIKDNIEGNYCCQLDSDDYYDTDFLKEAIKIGESNEADIVCVRTCLFSADSEFNPLNEGLVYDWHDKYYFNIVHPAHHFIGHRNILKAYAKSKICSTFWGKMYSNSLMKCYLDYLIDMPDKERELYYRLDIAMTYRILSMAERVFYSDRVMHYSQYSKKNSTFTLAPIEWLMSLWYAYMGIKEEMNSYYKEKKAKKIEKHFLKIHLPWMVGRIGMLDGSDKWNNKDDIIRCFGEMVCDPVFESVLLKRKAYLKSECRDFYDKIFALSGAKRE